MGKTTEAKSHKVNLRSALPRIHYYQSQAVTSNTTKHTGLRLRFFKPRLQKHVLKQAKEAAFKHAAIGHVYSRVFMRHSRVFRGGAIAALKKMRL